MLWRTSCAALCATSIGAKPTANTKIAPKDKAVSVLNQPVEVVATEEVEDLEIEV
jgi:hypothetical protein